MFDIVTEVRSAAKEHRLAELPTADAGDFIQKVTNRFLSEVPGDSWWWEILAEPVLRIVYERSDYPLTLLPILLGAKTNVILIVPPDGSRQPTAAFAGTTETVVSVLAEVPDFEFVLVDRELRWILADMHDNVLHIAGVLHAA